MNYFLLLGRYLFLSHFLTYKLLKTKCMLKKIVTLDSNPFASIVVILSLTQPFLLHQFYNYYRSESLHTALGEKEREREREREREGGEREILMMMMLMIMMI